MNIKRIAKISILTVLIVALIFSFSACKNDSEVQNEQQVVPSSTQQAVSQTNDENEESTSSSTTEKTVTQSANQKENNQVTYEQITPSEAKQLMDSENDYVILDVRTQQEYDDGHIEGAIVIPDYEIKLRAQEVLKDKDQLILVYCRSGRRSKLASQELANQGYTNVKEFGGIYEWQYGTVK